MEHCRNCQGALPPDSRFCLHCGSPTSDPWLSDSSVDAGVFSPPLIGADGEYRSITVMFVDLIDSMPLSEQLDAEELKNIMKRYHRICARQVEHHGGHVAQYLGDGVLAYFGFPTAHDDDAVRAVRAGTDIVRDMAPLRDDAMAVYGVTLGVRVGVHTGRVVMDELDADSKDRLALGRVPNLAARIQGKAPANTVVMSERSKRLVDQWIDVTPMGPATMKGVEKPVHLFRAVGDRGLAAHLRNDIQLRRSPVFVGRRREFKQLLAICDAARSGAQLVTISGEAGIGKSRLLSHFRQWARTEGALVLECYCSSYHRSSPLRPVLEMIERLLSLGGLSPEERRAALIQWRDEGPRKVDGAPMLAAVVAELEPSLTATQESAVSPPQQRKLLLQALADWLVSLADGHRLLLSIEDVHWADPSTLDLIEQLHARGPEAPVAIATTTRPNYTPPWVSSGSTAITLEPLCREEAERLFTHLAGKPLAGRLLTVALDRAGGVPLFIEELAGWFLASGHVIDAGESWRFAPDAAITSDIPDSLEAVLIAHLDRLEGGKAYAQIAAVLGRDFRLPVLAAVAGVAEEDVQLGLDALVTSGTLLEKQRGGEVLYVFKHALLQDAAYSSLLKATRQKFHERIVEVLREQFETTTITRPEVLAFHLERAGERLQAFEAWKQAGALASERAAATEAVEFLRCALAQIDAIPDETQRKVEELSVQAALAPALMATVGWASDEVAAASARARDLALELEDYTALYGALWGLWTVSFLRGETAPALEIAQAAVNMATQADETLLKVTSQHAYGFTRYYQGEFADAVAHADLGLQSFNLELERVIASMFLFSSSGALHAFRTVSLWMQGKFTAVEESSKAWLDLVERLDHGPSTAFALSFRLYLLHAQEDVEGVLTTARRLLAVSQTEEFQLWIAVARIFIAWASFRVGSLEASEATEALNESIASFRATRTRIISIEVAGMAYEIRKAAGDTEGALAALEQGIEEAATRGETVFLPELHRLRGEFAFECGEDGMPHYQTAWDVAEGQGATALSIRAAAAAYEQSGEPLWLERLQDAFSRVEQVPQEATVQLAQRLLQAPT